MITATPRSLTTRSTWFGMLTPVVLAVACGGGTDAEKLNNQFGQAGAAGTSTTGQAGSTGSSGQPAVTGGSSTGGSGTQPLGGMGGLGGAGPIGGSSTGGGGGSGGVAVVTPYDPRTGSFKMLVYSQNVTGGFKHDSIGEGQTMLKAIGLTQGFEVTVATDESEITPTGLAKYEIVFFMNSTGEIFGDGDQRKSYEDWIRNNGAYGGVHAAADTANKWDFYKEMTGQYYNGHDSCCASADIQWTPQGEGHFTVKGLPSPWTRAEEWYLFNEYSDWSSVKPGFTILSTVTTNGGGTRPVSYVREWGNFRSFYTSLGHETDTFKDPQMIKHVSAGIMWAVRREALLK